jgi:hypothetical protein
MKIWRATASGLLLALAGCRVVPSFPRQYTATNITTLIKAVGPPTAITSDAGDLHLAPRADPPPAKRPKPNPPSPPAEPSTPDAAPQSEWDKHLCRGQKLTQVSKLDKDKAEAIALPIGTQWSGNLEAERKQWGYFDSEDPDCDFEGSYYDITRALEALGVEDGDCFRTQHYDPEKETEIKDQWYKVGEKNYRVRSSPLLRPHHTDYL